jgi:hypothetical protein
MVNSLDGSKGHLRLEWQWLILRGYLVNLCYFYDINYCENWIVYPLVGL